jgi:hypothetical protein
VQRPTRVGFAAVTVFAIGAALGGGPASGQPGGSRQLAETAAASLVGQLGLPPGASPSSGEPPGADPALDQPQPTPPRRDVVNLRSWWTVAVTPSDAMSYVRAHFPPGRVASFTGESFSDSASAPLSEAGDYPGTRNLLSSRELEVLAAPAASGTTALRVDAQVEWVAPDQVVAPVPRSVRLLTVTVAQRMPGRGRVPYRLTIRSPAKMRQIVAVINKLPQLPVSLVHVVSCPALFTMPVWLAFRQRERGPVVALASTTFAASICNSVALDVRGRHQPPLDSGNLLSKVQAILGIKIPAIRLRAPTPPASPG